MKLYEFKVIDQPISTEHYNAFIVCGNSITDALENMYQYLCTMYSKYKDSIPFYLRSSNINISCIGEIELTKEFVNKKVLMVDYISCE